MAWDLVADFGADPTGTADSTASVQSAWNTIGADPFGGKLNVPHGAYKITAQTNYNSAKPLWIAGEGQQASQFRLASTSTSLGYLCIAQGASLGDINGNRGTVRVTDLGFYNDVTSGAFSNVNRGVYLSGVNHGEMANCGFYQGAASQKINQAVVLNGCNQFRVSNCDIWAVVNAVAYMGYSQVCTVEDSHLWTSPGSGVATAAALLYSGQTLGVAARHVICHDGDRGVLATQDGGGQTPHLFEFLDVETNNHSICHFDFEYGVHSTMVGCILSGAAISVNVPGLKFGANWQGESTVADTQLIGVPGHGVLIQGGNGYVISNCKWGGGGSYKAAANTYDELNVASAASHVSVTNSHFNTDANMGVGTSDAPRWAINSASSTFTQTDNVILAAGYYGSGQIAP